MLSFDDEASTTDQTTLDIILHKLTRLDDTLHNIDNHQQAHHLAIACLET